MGYYVYKYVHPDYPWLYVGLTTELDSRIYTHNHSSGDNIDRKWEKQLNESTIYYHECSDEQDMKTTEKYLINAFKPVINKMDKSMGKSSIPQVDIGWNLYIEKIKCDKAKSSSIKKSKDVKRPRMISWRDEYHRILSEYLFNKYIAALDNGYSMISFDLSSYDKLHREYIIDNIAEAFIISDDSPTGWTLIHADSGFVENKDLTYVKFHLNKRSEIEHKYKLAPYKPYRTDYEAVYLGSNDRAKRYTYNPLEKIYLEETFKCMDNAQFSHWDEEPLSETWKKLSKKEQEEALNNIIPGVWFVKDDDSND